MPYRYLPRSDQGRTSALSIAKSELDSLAPGKTVLSPEVIARLNELKPLFDQKTTLKDVALSVQTGATAAIEEKREKARMYISHFIQIFNMGVARGLFPEAARAYYGLAISSAKVPNLSIDAHLRLWGDNLIRGDAVRVAGGGAAMPSPTIEELTAVFTDFKNARIAYSNLKEAYDLSQEAVAELRKNVDLLIYRIWNEVEAAFSDKDAASRRRKARLWGVTYKNLPEEYSITGKVHDMSNVPIEGAEIRIKELGVVVHSDKNGEFFVTEVDEGSYSIIISKDGFITVNLFNFEIEDGTTKTIDAQMMLEEDF